MALRAVSTWSLHRTLGRSIGGDSAVHGGPFMKSTPTANGLALLDLPAELHRRGYDMLQVCHFHLPTRSPSYLAEFRAALFESHIELEALLIDDGDLSDSDGADVAESWIGEWLEVAVALGAQRARVSAGRSVPTEAAIASSASRLVRLARAYPDVRIVTENWHRMMTDADSVLGLLAETGDSVGLLIDLGNWKAAQKYADLAKIAHLAETCHAKCHFTGSEPDEDDFTRSLQILKDANFAGPLALIYDGSDDDEWGMLDVEFELVRQVFG
jgi:sugar phosphate isomerase/epimerase